ncbi:MAG: O-antigen ligase family protein, partial [Actinomycetota bacterium]|nr:O-antigen ligase family protein [Actinomycetota bacterium]
FGYANAKAAFFLQAAVAALICRELSEGETARSAWAVAACVAAVVPVASRSTTGMALLLLPAVVLAAPQLRISRRTLVPGMAVAFAAVLAGTVLIGLTNPPGKPAGPGRSYLGVIDQRRADLWRDALSLMEAHPLAGVGPGRFDQTSPVAMSDRDTRWAHNGFLQQGAETGIVGLLLLLNIFFWAFVRLYKDEGRSALLGLGAASLAALAIHASVDYVFHFPAIPVATALLVGSVASYRGSTA